MESGIETSVSVFVLTLGCLFVLKILGSKNSPCFFSSSTFKVPVPVLFWNFLLVCLSLISPLLCCIKQSCIYMGELSCHCCSPDKFSMSHNSTSTSYQELMI